MMLKQDAWQSGFEASSETSEDKDEHGGYQAA
jgi:hypothetical protein